MTRLTMARDAYLRIIRGDEEVRRGVAQPGRALRSGRRGRRFESSHPDHDFLLF